MASRIIQRFAASFVPAARKPSFDPLPPCWLKGIFGGGGNTSVCLRANQSTSTLRSRGALAKPGDTQEDGSTWDQTVVQPICRSALTATLRAP